jgi:hypothetical protein
MSQVVDSPFDVVAHIGPNDVPMGHNGPSPFQAVGMCLRRIGRLISERRVALGETPEHIAAACGIHADDLERLERGEVNVSLSTMLLVCFRLRITPAVLFCPSQAR